MHGSGPLPWPRLAALCVLAPALVLALAPAEAGSEQLASGEQQKLPKLFDFEHYKNLFGKRYHSMWEELSRKRLFMSRALRAFASAVKYKFRRSGHYNAVNELSDRSAVELHMMRNKLMELEDRVGKEQRGELAAAEVAEVERPGGLPELIPSEGENVEEELLELLAEHGAEPEFAQLRDHDELKLKRQRRRRRHVAGATSSASPASPASLKPRELPLSWLINTGQADGQQALRDKQKPIVRNPRSNNPQYQPFDSASFGLRDQQEAVKWWWVDKRSMKSARDQLVESVHEREQRLEPAERSKLPDELFVDHRAQGCLLEPRQQGACGACYAFAVTSMMEWLLCQKSGRLVPLSEQYMIDCGKGRYDSMAGCEGGSVLGSALFVHNFGLELQKNYPYFSRQGHCPYEDHFDLKKTGFIRMELGDAVNVNADLWERILKYSPIYIKARTGDDFIEYGGGVYRGQGCAPTTNHAMVLIGHGRQDGEQYWLLRNSMGVNWGERGYWKLAKTAADRCLDPNGVAFGTRTGTKFDVKPRNSNPKAKKA